MPKSLPKESTFDKRKIGHDYDWLTLITKLKIDPIIEHDPKTDTYTCKDKAVEKLIQIATNGDSRWMRSFFHRTGPFRLNVLRDNDGRIRMFLLANALDRALNGDMAWSKHALDIIGLFEKKPPQFKGPKRKGKYRYGYKIPKKGEKATDPPEEPGDVDELLGLGGKGEVDPFEESETET